MVLLAITLMVILVVCVTTFLRSVMGKPVRGVLHVPQGNNHVDVAAFDCRCLKPYKCGQVFDAEVVPTEHAMTSIYTGEERSGRGAISFKGTPIGFADWDNSYSQVLWTLTSMYTRVVVRAVILGIDADGRKTVFAGFRAQTCDLRFRGVGFQQRVVDIRSEIIHERSSSG